MGGAKAGKASRLRGTSLLGFKSLVVFVVFMVALTAAWVSVLAHDIKVVTHDVDDAELTCYPCVALDPGLKVHVVYGARAGVMLSAENHGEMSEVKVVGSPDQAVIFSVLALSAVMDVEGLLHVASISHRSDETGNKLIYSREAPSGEWHSTVLDEGVYDNALSLALHWDGADIYAHVLYSKARWWSNWWFTNLTYATDSSGNWTCYDAMQGYPYTPQVTMVSVSVDSHGHAHAVFMDDHLVVYASNLTGTPEFAFIAGPRIEPSIVPGRPSVVVDHQDVIHALCTSTRLDLDGNPVETTIVHYMADGGSGTYANLTLDSDKRMDWAATSAELDTDGDVVLFYACQYRDRVIGYIRIHEGTLSERELYKLQPWDYTWYDRPTTLSVVSIPGSMTVIAKPFGPPGYLTDSFSFSERLSEAIAPVKLTLVRLILLELALLALTVVLAPTYWHETYWRRVAQDLGDDDVSHPTGGLKESLLPLVPFLATTLASLLVFIWLVLVI